MRFCQKTVFFRNFLIFSVNCTLTKYEDTRYDWTRDTIIDNFCQNHQKVFAKKCVYCKYLNYFPSWTVKYENTKCLIFKRNFKWPSMQRWQRPIYNSTLNSFDWSMLDLFSLIYKNAFNCWQVVNFHFLDFAEIKYFLLNFWKMETVFNVKYSVLLHK